MSPPPRVWNPFQIEPTPFNLKRCVLITVSTSGVRGIISRLGTDGFLVHVANDGGPTLASMPRGCAAQRQRRSNLEAGRGFLTGKMTQDVPQGHLSKGTLRTVRNSENADARILDSIAGSFNAISRA
jgi:hypothetical protein